MNKLFWNGGSNSQPDLEAGVVEHEPKMESPILDILVSRRIQIWLGELLS